MPPFEEVPDEVQSVREAVTDILKGVVYLLMTTVICWLCWSRLAKTVFISVPENLKQLGVLDIFCVLFIVRCLTLAILGSINGRCQKG